MVFGFGFNKAKTFASAEKSVKQGKLQNAIADYEKISKEDPRDLNVLNTLGDLYARVGNVERATECFKRCGEAYAAEGFTVKAIAMYKKVTKQNPSATEAVAKLAELYAQHGLFNDARVQYSQVVDQHLRNNQVEQAIAVLQKILEFDPENSQLQGRMAELYVRIGKKAEARDLYFRSAQTLRVRGALEGCDKALASVLELEPGFAQALLLRAQVKLEAEDAAGAVQCLESLPDIDSRPEALRMLLRSYLTVGNREEAEPLARKLLTVYNDPAGISQYADHLISAGQFDAALGLYSEYAERLLAADAGALVQTLHALIARVKDHARSLETLSGLFQKAGDTTHTAEVTELLAHACVHDGDLEKARDLYRKLSEVEPENPLHLQNYRQIMARLGEDSTMGSLAGNEGAPAFLMDELEDAPASIEQDYAPELASAIQDSLTDAELFSSYNLPARAIPLLEAVLPQAPRDVRLNQRLASLYVRTGQFAEAAKCCAMLHDVYAGASLPEQAGEYAEAAARYRERAGAPAEPVPVGAATGSLELQTPSDETQAEPVEPPAAAGVTQAWPEEQWGMLPSSGNAAARSEPAAVPLPVFEMAATPAEPVADAVAHEIDLSEEWDRVLKSDDVPDFTTQTGLDAGGATLPGASPWDVPSLVRPSPATAAAVGDLVEEARFYVSQSMWDEARMALSRAEAMVPGAPAVLELKAQLPAQAAASSEPEIAAVPEPAPPESLPAFPQAGVSEAVSAFSDSPEAVVPETAPEAPGFPEVAAMPPEQPIPASSEGVGILDGFVADLEQSLGDDFVIQSPEPEQTAQIAASVPAEVEPVEAPAPSSAAAEPPSDPAFSLNSLFDEFKRDMEGSSALADDIETHYNMGLAFKEMGLFDEAIAELQKAASEIERGVAFPQVLETYTWLADCFVSKGVPEAGAHWYKKALGIPGLSSEQALAVNYELACAEEAAGDIGAARTHFMHVLSLNIDYRDVAERIKALKS